MKKLGGGSKKGQVTIFIIVAVIIVIAGILVYMFYPQIGELFGFGITNPSEYIQSCIEDKIKDTVEILSPQGGSLKPGHYILYNNEKIEYLCYTEAYYKTCVMQQPMLKNHIESEVEGEIEEEVENCFNSLEEKYRDRGYTVNLKEGEMDVELKPKKIVTTFNHTLTLTKESSSTYEKFIVILDNNLYESVSIANSILNWEATYGDAETTIYMNYYHDLKVEKKKQSEGSTIYILTERDTGNKFQFASRSVAWPPGYGMETII